MSKVRIYQLFLEGKKLKAAKFSGNMRFVESELLTGSRNPAPPTKVVDSGILALSNVSILINDYSFLFDDLSIYLKRIKGVNTPFEIVKIENFIVPYEKDLLMEGREYCIEIQIKNSSILLLAEVKVFINRFCPMGVELEILQSSRLHFIEIME